MSNIGQKRLIPHVALPGTQDLKNIQTDIERIAEVLRDLEIQTGEIVSAREPMVQAAAAMRTAVMNWYTDSQVLGLM